MKNQAKQQTITKHTVVQTILLHLLPGAIQFIIMILLIPLALHLGFVGVEGFFAGNLGDLIAMVPLQIGFLLFVAKKTTNTYNISVLIPFKEKAKLWEYLIFIVLMIVWALCIDAVLSPFENGLRDSLFSFVPDAVAFRNMDFSTMEKGRLIFVLCFSIFSNGIVAPLTEELYFRGFLLPRISLSPFLAVLVNAVLFSAYHFFSPWYFFSRLLMMLPIYYWVMKRKNIRFSLVAHMIANIYTGVSLLLSMI